MNNTFEHERKCAWELYNTDQDKEAVEDLAQEYIVFLTQCKTEREVVKWVQDKAEKFGFKENLSSHLVYKTAQDKTILLARKGKRSMSEGIRILGAHADAPRLDLKQHPLYEACDLALAKTHYYGGIRKHQWLSRPLALHGVVVKTNGERVEVCIGEDQKDPVFVIADLLPHLAQKQNEQKLSEAFEAEKLNVLLGNIPMTENNNDKQEPSKEETRKLKKQILKLLFDNYKVVEEDLFSAELQVVPAGPARSVGLDQSMVGGYGQDDRICVFSVFKALLEEEEPEYTQVVIFWDKEEIGSEGATSARSMFLEYTIKDLLQSWEPETYISTVFQQAKAVSADVHGAIDPDYQDLHDQLNASRLGFGPVFCKFTGHRGKIGANDASAEYVGWFRNLLNKENIPWQMAEIGKVDAGGGGTVAKLLAVYGMDIIDFGPSVLGMHSPFEISSKVDLYATKLAYRAFLRG